MGADAQAAIECRYSGKGVWWHAASLNVPRNYYMFGAMAGVRRPPPERKDGWPEKVIREDVGHQEWSDFELDEDTQAHLEHYECWKTSFTLRDLHNVLQECRFHWPSRQQWWLLGVTSFMAGLKAELGETTEMRFLIAWDQG